MSDIIAGDGSVLHVRDTSIMLITGAEPGDPAPRAYVSGPAPDRIPVREDAVQLVARLPDAARFARLTRLDGTPLWVAAGAVSLLRRPVETESPAGAPAGAMLCLGGSTVAVREEVAEARGIIVRHGGQL